jgi:hypothetical protein
MPYVATTGAGAGAANANANTEQHSGWHVAFEPGYFFQGGCEKKMMEVHLPQPQKQSSYLLYFIPQIFIFILIFIFSSIFCIAFLGVS